MLMWKGTFHPGIPWPTSRVSNAPFPFTSPLMNSRRFTPISSHHHHHHHHTGSQQQTEMNQAIEEQKEMIIELEDERRASRSLVADLKNKIRKLEMAQFELAEADSLGPGSQRAQALKSPPGSRSRSRDVAQSERKVREVEGLLEKERKARAEEQHQSTERIASLEAELTITKAELSVAKLMSGEK